MSVAHRLEKRETEDTCAFRPTQRVEEPADHTPFYSAFPLFEFLPLIESACIKCNLIHNFHARAPFPRSDCKATAHR